MTDLLTLLNQHLAIVGKTGSGKTFTAKGFVEWLLGKGRQAVVLDPTGAWWGLRLRADGTTPGFPIPIFGGDHADVPLADRNGEALAQLVVERRLSCVVDLSLLLQGESHRFVTEFIATLHRLNRAPLHLVIDEADAFAPQNPMPETRRMVGEVDRLVRRGRIRGFRCIFITQRPAVLHKNVLTQVNAIVAHRLPAPQDRKAIEEWVKGHADDTSGKEVLATLAHLRRGEGWLWAPEQDVLERRQFPPIATFDSSREPEEGADLPVPARLEDIDIAGLREAFGAVAEAEPEGPTRDHLAAAEQRGHDRGYEQGYAEAVEVIRTHVSRISEAVHACVDWTASVRPAATATGGAAPAPVSAAEPRPRTTGTIHRAAAAILEVMLRHYPARLTWSQAATLAGLKARGGHFNAGRKDLRDRGLIVEDGDLLAPATPPSGHRTPQEPAETAALWLAKLPSPAPEMLRHLIAQGDRFVARVELAAAIGKQPHGGHWNSGMKMLRDNALIEERDGSCRAAALLRG